MCVCMCACACKCLCVRKFLCVSICTVKFVTNLETRVFPVCACMLLCRFLARGAGALAVRMPQAVLLQWDLASTKAGVTNGSPQCKTWCAFVVPFCVLGCVCVWGGGGGGGGGEGLCF